MIPFKILLLITSSFLPIPTHGMEIVACDCDKPIFIGLLDVGEPHFCNQPSNESVVEVSYELISKKDPPLTNTGFLCRQWFREKTIVGYFFGAYDTTFLETPYSLSIHECAKMAFEKTCDNNEMIDKGFTASFNSPPTGEGSWMTTKTYKIANCELEVFNVSQDCATCPVKSPFGILNPDSSNNITSLRKGYLTYIWRKPVAPKFHCNYHISRKGQASLFGFSNTVIKHLRDKRNQLEFIMKGSPETISNFENTYKVKGLPDTFIRFYQNPPSVRHPSLEEASFFIANDFTDYCFGKPKRMNGTRNIFQLRLVKCGSGNPMNPTPSADQPEKFQLINQNLIPSSDRSLCVTITKDLTNVNYQNCQDSLEHRQIWTFGNTSGRLYFSSITDLFPFKYETHYCLGTSLYPEEELHNMTIAVISCRDVDYDLQLKSQPRKIHGKWKFQEVELEVEPDSVEITDSAIIEEASHHQYTSGTFYEIANVINDELRNVYCESLKTKQFLAMMTAQYSPMLAGITLGLPVCQRVQANGQSLIIQQCKDSKVSITTQRTKCGFEPKFGHFTVGQDGFTRTKFRPCTWSNGIFNLNGKTYEFANNTWIPVKPNIKLSSIGLKAHFEEEVDIEARYLHNLETSFHSKEIEQMNMIGELMAVMRHDEINPITPILAHLDENSRFNWSWTIFKFYFLLYLNSLVYNHLCNLRYLQPKPKF